MLQIKFDALNEQFFVTTTKIFTPRLLTVITSLRSP